MDSPTPKSIGIVLRQAPYGNILAQEAIEASLAASVFEQTLSVIFLGDGVFQLIKGQDGASIKQKNLEKQLAAFELYEIDKVYVCENSLVERGIKADKLSIDITILNQQTLTQILHQQDVLLSF